MEASSSLAVDHCQYPSSARESQCTGFKETGIFWDLGSHGCYDGASSWLGMWQDRLSDMTIVFFYWLQGQVVMVEDYAYAGLDFRGDPDLVLPEDAQWGNIGKKYTNF